MSKEKQLNIKWLEYRASAAFVNFRTLIGVVIACMMFSVAASDTVIFSYVSESGIPVFTDRQPLHVNAQVKTIACIDCPKPKLDTWSQTPLILHQYGYSITQAAKVNQLDAALIRAVIHVESSFNPLATSKQGAQGLMQLMPDTAKLLGVSNAYIASENIRAGSEYLARMIEQFQGNIRLGLAAYNAGPGKVKKYQGIPPYRETKDYVKRVENLYRRYKSESI